MYSSERKSVLWMWLLAFGFLLVSCGLILNTFTVTRINAIQDSIVSIEQKQSFLLEAMPIAEDIVAMNSGLYAKRWTSDLPDLQHAKSSLRSGGDVETLLVGAKTALDEKDFKSAQSYLNQAEILLNQADESVRLIVGPPTYFDELARKSAEAEGYLVLVEEKIFSIKSSIENLQQDIWNSSKGVRFDRAVARLGEAENQLALAKQTIISPLENDNVLYDFVWAYDLANVAMNMVEEAITWADEDQLLARNADVAISDADLEIVDADIFVKLSLYNMLASQQSQEEAKDYLEQSRVAFAQYEYKLAIDLANKAKFQAQNSILLATEPTSDDSDTTESWFNTGTDSDSDSDSWDSSSDDWGSSDSWDSSSDDWGSSDSWDSSSDDWGSSDSWDSGSDDWGSSDSWDSSSDDWGSSDGW